MPRIEVDFNNCDREGRVRLNTGGAIQSLNELPVALLNGLEVECKRQGNPSVALAGRVRRYRDSGQTEHTIKFIP